MMYYGRALTTVRFDRSLILTAEPHAGFSTTKNIIRQNRQARYILHFQEKLNSTLQIEQRFHLYVKQLVMLISTICPGHAAYLMTPIIDVNAKNILPK